MRDKPFRVEPYKQVSFAVYSSTSKVAIIEPSYVEVISVDPITTSVLASLSKLSETAILDAYNGLKALIVKKFGKTNDVIQAIEKLEQKPDSVGRRQILEEEIAASKVGQDSQIMQAAGELIKKLGEQAKGKQVIQQNVSGNQNIFSATGDVKITIGPAEE